ncbi:right-handed parallel beta-helix repeat-containing protein [Aurantimonas sp. Leaf443]|uniref:right-handed parallel beta-helix repeat-containing protein n=1 Tax=Aurantimonas sp. Leaf443 TaxID=1736378 RepID=UPI0006F4BF96|nr:right-handed parallel beta-helix repeat-containing protein [Aurantimonas sp. Leaf443]KQT88374.1 hypothetical protein ASG48_02835 [Aurantimonas sp. Leaf443]
MSTLPPRLALAIAALLASGSPLAAQASAAPTDLPDAGRAARDAGPRPGRCPAGAVQLAPGEDLGRRAAGAPEGTAFCIGSGLHRLQTIAPRNGQAFFGEPGAILSGAGVLAAFSREGGRFVSAAAIPVSERRGLCLDERPACDRPETVFLDGVPLEQVTEPQALEPGRFLVDARGRVVLADDPAGRLVEAGGARYAFLSNGARGVTVSDLTVEKYANPAQRGAIYDDRSPAAADWRIEHNDVRLNAGLGILAGPGAAISGNLVHHNGQLGISFSDAGVLIEGNVVAYNNLGGFDPAWEGGGVKGALATDTILRGNDVHGNVGPGLWCDIECRGTVYEDNRIADNDGAGLFHEISYEALVRRNLLLRNGRGDPGWFWGAGILVAASRGVRVEENVVEVLDDRAGIALVDQGRPVGEGPSLHRTEANRVERNTVRFEGAVGRNGGVSDVDPGSENERVIETGGNVFRDNRYLSRDGARLIFVWGRTELDLDGLKELGQEAGSSLDAIP